MENLLEHPARPINLYQPLSTSVNLTENHETPTTLEDGIQIMHSLEQ